VEQSAGGLLRQTAYLRVLPYYEVVPEMISPRPAGQLAGGIITRGLYLRMRPLLQKCFISQFNPFTVPNIRFYIVGGKSGSIRT
jgi:hypothetical protein